LLITKFIVLLQTDIICRYNFFSILIYRSIKWGKNVYLKIKHRLGHCNQLYKSIQKDKDILVDSNKFFVDSCKTNNCCSRMQFQ
jgi:hypothetical protein